MTEQIRKILSMLSARTKVRVASLFALMTLNTVLEMFGIGIVFPLFQALANPDIVRDMPVLGTIYTDWMGSRTDIFILVAGSAILVMFTVKNAVLAANIYVQNRVVMSEQADLASALLRFYLSGPYAFHLEHNSAELIRNIQILAFRFMAKGLLPMLQIALEIMAGIGVMMVLVFVNLWATLGTAAIMTACMAVFYRFIHRKMFHWGERSIHYDGEILRTLQQSLGAVKTTKLSGTQEFFCSALGTYNHARGRIISLSTTATNLPRLFIEVVAIGAMICLVFILLVVQGKPADIVLPTLGLFAFGALRLMPAFSKIVSNLTVLRENKASIDALNDHLPGAAVHALPRADAPGTASAAVAPIKDIRVEGASFRYARSEIPALDDIDVTIEPGRSVAFVGRSGSGKTTLIDVILGLLEPTRGCVRVDGADIRGRETEWWPRIGYVPQEIYLFDDTIRRNIALGIPDERIDEERLREAVAMAQLDDVVAESPQGLDTVVGERGARLSGGQRQRIGIARALYGRPGVLVLDEATSALDVETEARISDAIRALAGRMTVIIVAHRLSTVRHCDRLYFMEHGRIVAEGAYDDLLRDCAAFREMAAMAGLKAATESPVAQSGSGTS